MPAASPTKKTQPGSHRHTVRTPPAPRPPASPAKTAKAAAAAHKLDDECIAPLAALIGATWAWLTLLTISQVGPRIAIAWMLLHRRDGNVLTAGDVYELLTFTLGTYGRRSAIGGRKTTAKAPMTATDARACPDGNDWLVSETNRNSTVGRSRPTPRRDPLPRAAVPGGDPGRVRGGRRSPSATTLGTSPKSASFTGVSSCARRCHRTWPRRASACMTCRPPVINAAASCTRKLTWPRRPAEGVQWATWRSAAGPLGSAVTDAELDRPVTVNGEGQQHLRRLPAWLVSSFGV